MKLLILGGTVFLGRHITEAALARDIEVTHFNRGQSNRGLFSGAVEELRGDRGVDLSALAGRRWDAVIDTCGYLPRVVRRSAELLSDAVEHYTFISSISVYEDFSQPGLDEGAATARLEDPATEEVKEHYGALKAACEEAVLQVMPGRALVVRPGLIVGPHDPSGRFSYWVDRVARGGQVLAPGDGEDPVQIIDARDLAGWLLEMVERRETGTFNATGPPHPYRLADVMEVCREVAGADADIRYVPREILEANEVGHWMELPLWLPEGMSGMMAIDVSAAVEAGLDVRPLKETVADTLAWLRAEGVERPEGVGLSAERERELLGQVAGGGGAR